MPIYVTASQGHQKVFKGLLKLVQVVYKEFDLKK